jgi:soluble lytic murein transglycosylase-like protein
VKPVKGFCTALLSACLLLCAGNAAHAAPQTRNNSKATPKTEVKPAVSAPEAYREVLQWATGRTQAAYLDGLFEKIERSSYRYGILPEFALAVIASEAKYGRGISFARQDSWRMYETATKRQLKSYPHVMEDLDTALSELRQIMSSSQTMDQVFLAYWCGSDRSMNTDSYAKFSEAAGKLWNGLEPYARERMRVESPDKYKSSTSYSNDAVGAESNWGGLAYGDMDGYRSKLGAMPKLASQLKSYPVEKRYAEVAKYYNKKLSDSEALVIARAVLTFCEQTDGVVDPRLVMALIKAESNFRTGAVSRVGALGLGQLMPATARGLGIRDPLDPIQNIYGCVKYLEREMHRWRGNSNKIDLVLASYNAGPGAVKKYKGVPPYTETRNYVKKVKQHYSTYTR